MLWGGYHTGKEVPAECLIQMVMIFKHMNIEDWGCTLFALSAFFFSVKLIRLCGLNIEMRASMYSISAEKKIVVIFSYLEVQLEVGCVYPWLFGH